MSSLAGAVSCFVPGHRPLTCQRDATAMLWLPVVTDNLGSKLIPGKAATFGRSDLATSHTDCRNPTRAAGTGYPGPDQSVPHRRVGSPQVRLSGLRTDGSGLQLVRRTALSRLQRLGPRRLAGTNGPDPGSPYAVPANRVYDSR